MLQVFFGRENINKDRFIYETIKGKTKVIVPDQFTVQAERDAFFYMQSKAMMDIEILSFSRLADRIFGEVGGGRTSMIDKQGRHMLLTQIMEKAKKELKVYKNYCGNSAFIEMANNFISETKQYGRSPDELKNILDNLPKERYLRLKLEDMQLIYEKYEEAIKGKYIDTEDKTSIMIEKISQSKIVAENEFMIYGFDYFAPKNKEIITELIKCAPKVQLVLTWDNLETDKKLFEITDGVLDFLKKICEGNDVEFIKEKIGEEYLESRPGAIEAIEKNLFALPMETTEETQGVSIVKAAGYYSEAETAAAKVLQLVREKGMRYRDIAVICNDLNTRGNIYKRTFAQYGLNLYVDNKKSIVHNPAVNYILALTNIIAGAYRPEDVMNLLKTGLVDLEDSDIEVFENYVRIYGIRGPGFREEFQKGISEIGSEQLEKLNIMRKQIIDPIMAFAEKYKEEKSVENRVKSLYEYITDVCKLPDKIEINIKEMTAAGNLENAAESAQIWNIVIGIFDQLIDAIGSEVISQKDFAQVLKSGFEAVKIGMIPPEVDGIMMGTMQRTRTGNIKALLVLGANEGVIPAEGSSEGILSEDEKLELSSMGMGDAEQELCKLDKLKVQEENLAIYRNLVKPTEELWISCSVSDEEGKAIGSSQIYENIISICSKVEVEQDIISNDNKKAMTSGIQSGINHMIDAYSGVAKGESLDPWWKETYLWYKEHMPEVTREMKKSLLFENTVNNVEKAIADLMYKKGDELSLSPSRLEKFGKCPFSHFVYYGLKPEELREYKVSAIEMGDIYHKCLMRLAKDLSDDDLEITDEGSQWMKISEEECKEKIGHIVQNEIQGYKEGIFDKNKTENYRANRIKEVCADAAWMMIKHVQAGTIESMQQEIRFGRGEKIDPIAIDLGNEKVYVEGIIDRVDYLPNENVKVIDYKSGNDKYNEKEALTGWKLQLFVYLRAACENNRRPAGAFYFHIADPEILADGITANEIKDKVSDAVEKAFKMDGIVVDEKTVIDSIDKDVSGWSKILPIRAKKEGQYSGTAGKLLSRDEMNALMISVSKNMDEMCRELASGKIEIKPKRNDKITACAYCPYKGICKFDISFKGCTYENI